MRIGIDDADDGAVGGRVFPFERKAGFFTATPKNQLANSSADRVNRDQWFSVRLQIFIQRLHDQEFATLKRFVLDGCYDSADDACELHVLVQCPKSNVQCRLADAVDFRSSGRVSQKADLGLWTLDYSGAAISTVSMTPT